jgi:hypothetical protein
MNPPTSLSVANGWSTMTPTTDPNQTQQQDQKLDYLTAHIVSQSRLSEADQQNYCLQLQAIDNHLADPTDVDENLAALNEWRTLSVTFYKQAGIAGKFVDCWGVEEQIEAVTTGMEEVDLNKDEKDVAEAMAEVEEMFEELGNARQSEVEEMIEEWCSERQFEEYQGSKTMEEREGIDGV